MPTAWSKDGADYATLYFRQDEDLMLWLDFATVVKGEDGFNHVFATCSKAPGLKIATDGAKGGKAMQKGQALYFKIPYGEFDKYNKDTNKYEKAQPTILDLHFAELITANELDGKVFSGILTYDPNEIPVGKIYASGIEGLTVLADSLEEAKALEGFNLPPLPAIKNGGKGGGKGSYSEAQKLTDRLNWFMGKLAESSNEGAKEVTTFDQLVGVMGDPKHAAYEHVAVAWDMFTKLI